MYIGFFGHNSITHLVDRSGADSLEKTLMLGKIEGRSRGQQRMRWLDGITDSKNRLTGKDLDAGKDWRQKGTTGDEMVGWHPWLDGHEFEQALGVGDGKGSLACCSPWVLKESETQLSNWTELKIITQMTMRSHRTLFWKVGKLKENITYTIIKGKKIQWNEA